MVYQSYMRDMFRPKNHLTLGGGGPAVVTEVFRYASQPLQGSTDSFLSDAFRPHYRQCPLHRDEDTLWNKAER